MRQLIFLALAGTVLFSSCREKKEEPSLKKPVIYFYPESDTEVSVELKTTGKLTFSYPDYATGWKGTAHPDGSIDVNGKHYPYLFWESEQPFNKFDKEIGCVLLHKENAVKSLEKHLTKLGFNEKEKTDFITYWGPQIMKHELVMAQFLINEECEEFATLDIQPTPAHLNRVYMIWTNFDLNSSKIPLIKTQILRPLTRDGFDILEWGGMEISEKSLLLN